mgnify:CR=1 FL=1
MHNQGLILSREKIENHIWNFDYEGGTNVVDVYISYLRRKIDSGHDRHLIHTVRGRGYVLRRILIHEKMVNSHENHFALHSCLDTDGYAFLSHRFFCQPPVIQKTVRDNLIENVERNVDEVEYYETLDEIQPDPDFTNHVDLLFPYKSGFPGS